MSERAGEKTEQATPRRLEEALKKGQFARSAEVQTVFVLGAAFLALRMAGPDAWLRLRDAFQGIFYNLDKVSISHQNLQMYFINGVLLFGACVGRLAICTIVGALLAGGIQSRFNTASEALDPD